MHSNNADGATNSADPNDTAALTHPISPSPKTHLSTIFRPYFFNTWFTDFFQNIKVGEGKKIKITKKKFLYLIRNIFALEEKNNKSCTILHCKNAEKAIFFFFF